MKNFITFLFEERVKYPFDKDPIHFKNGIFKEINESTLSIIDKKYNNSHLGKDIYEVGDKLHSIQPKIHNEYYKKSIKTYTKGNNNKGVWHSKALNTKLINNYSKDRKPTFGMSEIEKGMHASIETVANKKIGTKLHIFSGTGFDPEKLANQNKDKTIISPAHMSFTHDLHTARQFTHQDLDKEHESDLADKPIKYQRHIMHIEMKPHDHGYYLGDKHSDNEGESEVLLPHQTKFKHLKSEDITDHRGTFRLHHFSIKD